MKDHPLKGLHAVGYCRVSTDDKGQTNETQKRLIGQWAEARGVIVDSYFMDEISGAKFPRPALSDALIALEVSDASLLICYDTDRLTRAGECDASKINQMVKARGATIHYVMDGDLDPNSMGGKITRSLKTIFAEEELKKIHDRTREGMKTRIDEGQHVARPATLIITADPSQLPRGLIGKADGSTIHGKNRKVTTRIISPSEVLNFARAGLSPYRVSKLLEVSPATFLSALERANLKDTYYKVMNGGE